MKIVFTQKKETILCSVTHLWPRAETGSKQWFHIWPKVSGPRGSVSIALYLAKTQPSPRMIESHSHWTRYILYWKNQLAAFYSTTNEKINVVSLSVTDFHFSPDIPWEAVFCDVYTGQYASAKWLVSCTADRKKEELLAITKLIVPSQMKHHAEAEACDLLMEVELLDLLEQYVDEAAYNRWEDFLRPTLYTF